MERRPLTQGEECDAGDPFAEMPGILADGEAVGLTRDGLVIFWGSASGRRYVTGVRFDGMAGHGLGFIETDRLERDVARYRLAPLPAPVGHPR